MRIRSVLNVARQLERALEQLVLLRVGEAGAELVALRAERRLRRAGPVDFEDRRREARDAQREALQDAPRPPQSARRPSSSGSCRRPRADRRSPMPNSRDATSHAWPKSCEISSVRIERLNGPAAAAVPRQAEDAAAAPSPASTARRRNACHLRSAKAIAARTFTCPSAPTYLTSRPDRVTLRRRDVRRTRRKAYPIAGAEITIGASTLATMCV